MMTKNVLLFCFILFVLTLGLSICNPILPLFANEIVASTFFVFLMYSSRDIVQIFLRLPSGSLSDRIGRRPVIIFGGICFFIAQIIFFLSKNLAYLFLAFPFIGVGMAFFFPSSKSMMADMSSSNQIGERMGLYNMTVGLGYLIGPLIGGFLADAFAEYRSIFLLGLTLVFFGTLLFFLGLDETNPQQSRDRSLYALNMVTKEIVNVPKLLKHVFRKEEFLVSSLPTFVNGFISGPVTFFFPIYALDIGLSESMIGACLAASSVTTFLAFYIGKLSDIVGRSIPIISGLAMYAVLFFLIPTTHNFYLLLLILFFLGLGSKLINVSTMAEVAESSDQEGRGAGLGVWGMMWRLGMSVGSLVMSVFALFDLVYVFYAAGFVGVITLILTYLVARARDNCEKNSIS